MSEEEENKNKDAEAAKYRRLARNRKLKAEELEAKLADVVKAHETAIAEIASLKQTPSKEAARIAELESQIRTRTHRDAFEKAAKGRIKDSAMDAAWTLSGYAPETDEVDETMLGTTIQTLLESNDFLAAADAATPEQGDSASPSVTRLSGKSSPVPGLGRGPAVNTSAKTGQRTDFRIG